MGLRTFLEKIYDTSPFRVVRKEINRKIDDKLKEAIEPVKSAIVDLSHQLHDTKHFLDGRHFDQVRLLHRNIEDHYKIIANQAYSYYPALHGVLFPEFVKILTKIMGEGHHDLLPCAQLLFLEITKNYQMIPGGIWQLDYEIHLFNSSGSLPESERALPPPVSEERLKILIVSAMFPSIEHGGGLRLFDIIDQLSDSHEIDLFSMYTEESDRHSLSLLHDKLGQIKLVAEEEFTRDNLVSWLAELARPAGYYHVVQCEYPLSAKLISAARSFGRKIGFTFMECVTKSYLIRLRNSINDNDFTNLGSHAQSFWEFAVAEMLAARNTDFQIAMTEDDAADIARINNVHPVIIPTCLSPSEVISRITANQNAAPEGDTVVFLGYFNHFPNIDGVKWYLEKVHPRVRQEVPDYRFLVVGAGDTSSLQAMSLDDPNVEYTGRVDDITPHVLRGKVCVLPLISGAGIRGKLNQYSIAGRPSVSTTIGNLGLNYQDGESVLIADTPEAFASAIVRLLTDADFNRAIATRAKTFAQEHFTWARHLARLVDIYRA